MSPIAASTISPLWFGFATLPPIDRAVCDRAKHRGTYKTGGSMSIVNKRAQWLSCCACGVLPFLAASGDAATPGEARIELEEIVITGSRLRAQDLEGPAPVVVLGREEIERLGASNLYQVIDYVSQQPYTFEETRNFGGAQFAELRGVGVSTTLVLINGRRAIASGANIAANAFDLNTIPLAAVERIEVLSDSASAVYGADAMGGVINIILKKEIARPVLELEYGGAHGGAEQVHGSLSVGASSDRLRGSLIVDYYSRDYLLGEERDLWRNQDFRRFGGSDRRSLNANPGNVASRTPGNLPGLTTSFAAVPKGSSGVGLEPGDFEETAGQRNYESLYRFRSIVPKAERYSAALLAEWDVLPHTAAFGEVLYADRRNETQVEPASLAGTLVPASNPFNPFGVDVSANLLLTGLGPRHTVVESELLRTVVGVRGARDRWAWELSVLNTEENARSWNTNTLDSARMAAALAETDPSRAFNPFQDGPGGSPALLKSLVAERVISDYTSKATQVAGFIRGDLLSLPAGEVEAVIGAEWRVEDGFMDSPPILVSEDRRAIAAYGEMRMPLVSPSMGLMGAHRIVLNVAARYDRYSDFGSTFNPQYGLMWYVTRGLLVRASYGEAFRPPSLFELYFPRLEFPGTRVVDPRRNNETVTINTIAGGNPDLKPLEGESLSTGFVLTPFSGFRLSATYWRLKMTDHVATLLSQVVLNHETRFPDRVIREEPTLEDIEAGLPGRVVTVDTSRVNFGLLRTSGLDAQVFYVFDTPIGVFTPSVSATWVDSYVAEEAPGTPAVERVGSANVAGTIPEWRGVVALGWSWHGFSATLNARYVHGFKDATFSGELLNRRIPSQTLIDAQVSLDLNAIGIVRSGWLKGFRLTVGARNVFDRAPHFSDMSADGYDLSQGDLLQRFIYVRLGKIF